MAAAAGGVRMSYEELVTRLRKRAKELPERFSKNEENIRLFLAAADAIEELIKPQWIKFTKRPLEPDEQEEHPEWCYILDCEMPDDMQEILVSDGKLVWTDTYFDDYDECYLDGGADLDGLWWMPMPEPPGEAK